MVEMFRTRQESFCSRHIFYSAHFESLSIYSHEVACECHFSISIQFYVRFYCILFQWCTEIDDRKSVTKCNRTAYDISVHWKERWWETSDVFYLRSAHVHVHEPLRDTKSMHTALLSCPWMDTDKKRRAWSWCVSWQQQKPKATEISERWKEINSFLFCILDWVLCISTHHFHSSTFYWVLFFLVFLPRKYSFYRIDSITYPAQYIRLTTTLWTNVYFIKCSTQSTLYIPQLYKYMYCVCMRVFKYYLYYNTYLTGIKNKITTRPQYIIIIIVMGIMIRAWYAVVCSRICNIRIAVHSKRQLNRTNRHMGTTAWTLCAEWWIFRPKRILDIVLPSSFIGIRSTDCLIMSLLDFDISVWRWTNTYFHNLWSQQFYCRHNNKIIFVRANRLRMRFDVTKRSSTWTESDRAKEETSSIYISVGITQSQLVPIMLFEAPVLSLHEEWITIFELTSFTFKSPSSFISHRSCTYSFNPWSASEVAHGQNTNFG